LHCPALKWAQAVEMIASKSPQRIIKGNKKVPSYLVYEIMDGQPIYYKGYQDVLNGSKTLAEIMGSSTLQAFIVSYLTIFLGKSLSEEDYTILCNEAGLHLDKHNNLAGDILVFDAQKLSISSLSDHYANVPPKIVLEVDIAADTAHFSAEDYRIRKTQKLLDFGVEKVIWISTAAQKILMATSHEDWKLMDWDKPIEVLPGLSFNLGQYLADKGLNIHK
jgi:Uma2 family endonuclease